jgi:hypothetical protein
MRDLFPVAASSALLLILAAAAPAQSNAKLWVAPRMGLIIPPARCS